MLASLRSFGRMLMAEYHDYRNSKLADLCSFSLSYSITSLFLNYCYWKMNIIWRPCRIHCLGFDSPYFCHLWVINSIFMLLIFLNNLCYVVCWGRLMTLFWYSSLLDWLNKYSLRLECYFGVLARACLSRSSTKVGQINWAAHTWTNCFVDWCCREKSESLLSPSSNGNSFLHP